MRKHTKYVRTKLDLSRAIGVSRNTLDRYLCMPGAPERCADGWPLEAVTKFIAERAGCEATAAKTSVAIGALKAKEIGLRCDRMLFALQRERGEYVLKTEIAAKLRLVLGRMVQILEQRIVNELPTAVSGLDAAQVRIKARQIFDEAIGECRGLDSLLDDGPTQTSACT